MKRVAIIQSGVHEPCAIGAIYTSLSSYELRGLWDRWRNEVPEPDADSEFIEWAINNSPECSAVLFEDFELVTVSE